MTEWIIGLATVAMIFFVLTCILANRCLCMYQEIKKLERKAEDMRHSNTALKTQIDTLVNRLYAAPEVEKVTTLKLHLHMKQEMIDALREKVRKQDVLLKQKWEGAKNAAK